MNVRQDEMSVVGPRAEQPEMVREPAESILYQALRSRFRSRGDPTDAALGDMGNECAVDDQAAEAGPHYW